MIRDLVRTQLLAVALVAAVMLLGPIGASSAQTSGGAQYGGNLGQTAHGGRSPGLTSAGWRARGSS